MEEAKENKRRKGRVTNLVLEVVVQARLARPSKSTTAPILLTCLKLSRTVFSSSEDRRVGRPGRRGARSFSPTHPLIVFTGGQLSPRLTCEDKTNEECGMGGGRHACKLLYELFFNCSATCCFFASDQCSHGRRRFFSTGRDYMYSSATSFPRSFFILYKIFSICR